MDPQDVGQGNPPIAQLYTNHKTCIVLGRATPPGSAPLLCVQCISLVHSHWSSSYINALSLVQSFLQGALERKITSFCFLCPSLVLSSLWYKDCWLPAWKGPILKAPLCHKEPVRSKQNCLRSNSSEQCSIWRWTSLKYSVYSAGDWREVNTWDWSFLSSPPALTLINVPPATSSTTL